ncbi:MAG: prepilin-type N-terminal cleavage/methylation domain-containing protein [Synergistaceae bacterium]|nr:prepilin-type N-terminal cleavage/methylation domain-containing protein [Synergistaceae bacterium]
MRRLRAFTLIEILVAVALTGMVASLALAPVVYAVRQITETEALYSDEAGLRRAAAFMARETAAGLRLASVVVQVVAHERLEGGNDDVLIVATASPARQNLAAGSVVYKLLYRSVMDEDLIPGLYRWRLPGALPEKVEHVGLEKKDGQLVLPHVTAMKLSVFNPPDWVGDYSGKLPRGMRFSLSRGEEQVEYVFAFP